MRISTIGLVVCSSLLGALAVQSANVTADDLQVNNEITQSTSTATGTKASALGTGCTASGDRAHAQGLNSTASGLYSHAEGSGTTASGTAAHAEGISAEASGNASHAEGRYTEAQNVGSHAGGLYSIAQHDNSFIFAVGSSGNERTTMIEGAAHFERALAFQTNSVVYTNAQDLLPKIVIEGKISSEIAAAQSHVSAQGDISMGSFTNE